MMIHEGSEEKLDREQIILENKNDPGEQASVGQKLVDDAMSAVPSFYTDDVAPLSPDFGDAEAVGSDDGKYQMFSAWQRDALIKAASGESDPAARLTLSDLTPELRGRIERAQTTQEVDMAIRASLAEMPMDTDSVANDTRGLSAVKLAQQQIEQGKLADEEAEAERLRLLEEAQNEQNANRRMVTFWGAMGLSLKDLFSSEQALADNNIKVSEQILSRVTPDNISDKVGAAIANRSARAGVGFNDAMGNVNQYLDHVNMRPGASRIMAHDVRVLNAYVMDSFDAFRSEADRARRDDAFYDDDDGINSLSDRASQMMKVSKRIKDLSLTHQMDEDAETGIKKSVKLLDSNLEEMMERINKMMSNLFNMFKARRKDDDRDDDQSQRAGMFMPR